MDVELAKYGMTGVAISLVGLVAYMIKIHQKITGNHINHSTEAISKQTEAMSKLTSAIDSQTEVLRDLKDEVRHK